MALGFLAPDRIGNQRSDEDSAQATVPQGAGRAISRLAGFGILLVLLIALPPWIPRFPGVGLDYSWQAVLLHAVHHHWQWGRDIVFTYGPLGFLATRQYDSATYTLQLVAWSFLALSFGTGFITAAHRLSILTALVFAIIVLLVSASDLDPLVLGFPLLLVVVWCGPDRPLRRVALLGLVVSCGLLTTMKLNVLPLTLAGVAAIDFTRILKRRVPVFVAGYILTFLAIWLAAGQRLGNLPDYFADTLEVIGGYDASMQTFGSVPEILAYLISVLALVAFFAGGLLRRDPRVGLAPRSAIGLLGALFLQVSFKEGFVRQDLGHTRIAWLALCVMCSLLLLLPCLQPVGRTRRFSAGLAVATALVFALVSTLSPEGAGIAELLPLQLDLLPAKLTAMWQDLGDRNRSLYDAGARQATAAIAQSRRQPRLDGSVDILSSDQIGILAVGDDYKPRPVFQGYAAYTPYLATLNRHYFESDRAPSYVVFDTDAIDGRYPSAVDSLTWLALLGRYEPAKVEGLELLLKRRDSPVSLAPGMPLSRSVGFNQPQPLWTPPQARLVQATVVWRESALGRLLHFLLKPIPVNIAVWDSADRLSRYRLVPGNAEAGFLLSPTVTNAGDFLALYLPDRRPAAATISRFSIEIPPWASPLYKPEIDVTLNTLDPPTLKDDDGTRAKFAEGLLQHRIGYGRQISALDLAAGATLAASLPADAGRLDRVLIQTVTFGRAPSPYPIAWRASCREGDEVKELGQGSVDAATATDWGVFDLSFAPALLSAPCELLLSLTVSADKDIGSPLKIPMFAVTAAEASTRIGNVVARDLLPKISVGYLTQ